MARDQALVTCPAGAWTELTNADVTNITFQVISGSAKIRATTGSAPSALSDAGYVYHAHPADRQSTEGELNVAISSLAAVSGAVRVFASPINGRAAKIVVDHA